MFKKIVIASAILVATSTVALAEGAPYVGVNVGLNNNTSNFKNTAGNTSHLNSSGVTGGLFAGYGATVSQNIYLGGEAFLNGGSMSSSTKTTSLGITDKLKTTYSYGVDFIPGYKVTDTTMVYAKAGLVRTRFKLTQNPTPTSTGQGTAENTVTGGQLGLGLQTDLTKNVGVRGEFVHTSYNSFTAYGNRIKPANNQVNFGLVYKFD
jgi:outer membrane immunogenic protein